MKKNLLYLFTILCTLSFVTSCSDDDDDKALNAWKNLATDYTGANLTLTLDGASVTGKTVKFDATSADAGTLTLADIVAETGDITLDVKLTAADNGYDISGSKDMSGYMVSVSGKVTNDSKMTLAVTTKGWDIPSSDYKGDKLALKVNGSAVTDETVTFKSTSNTTADVTLKNIVNGLEEMVIPVKLLIVKSEQTVETYNFEGSNNDVEGYQVSVKGSVNTQGQMTMDVTVEGWKSIAKAYSGEELVMTLNGKAVTDNTVELKMTSATEGTLVVNGVTEQALEVPVTVEASEEGVYSVKGSLEYAEKNFISVIATISAAGVMNLEVGTIDGKIISKEYTNPRSLHLTYNGEVAPQNQASVITIDSVSATTVDLRLVWLVPGTFYPSENGYDNDGFVIKGISIKNEEGVYKLSGSGKVEEAIVSIEGSISEDLIMTAAVDLSITSPVVGKWKVKQNAGVGEVIFKFQSKDGNIKLPEDLVNLLPESMQDQLKEIADEQLNGLITTLFSTVVLNLDYIEFTETGGINVSYTKMGDETGTLHALSLSDYVSYFVRDGKVYIIPNLSKLLGMMSANKTKSWDAGDLFNTGLPLNMKIDGDVLQVSLDKEVIVPLLEMVLEMVPMLPYIKPDLLDQATINMITNIGTPVVKILSEANAFEVGLVLTK